MSGQEGSSERCTGDCPSLPHLWLYQTIIFATPVLFAFMLLLMFCMFYFRRRSGGESIHSHMRAQLFAEGLLATASLQGLSRSSRQRLPIIPFDEKFASTCQDSQCAVCLCDYQLNEKLQQLPVCNHSFHVQCIDAWLTKNATCPICRTSLSEVANVDPFQCLDALSMEFLQRRGDENRMWEDRVVSEVQDQSLQVRSDASNEEINHGVVLSEHDARPTSEHTINIERS